MMIPSRPPVVDPTSALPAGTRLAEFVIRHVIGVGGFGIVYLAFDEALQREVAIKEYMPSNLAGRTASLHVSLRSSADAATFALGLRSFVNEARLLARFDHPSLVKVHRFWEANGTAYMVMPVYRGRTLKAVRRTLPATPDEGWMRLLIEPLLDAIEQLHTEGVCHRDIAPDNILIEPDGRPVLLDFGAARRVLEDRSRMLTAILKPAYAPIEQYAEHGAVRQGPWTDLYALGATLHFMLRGRPPSPATVRAVQDDAQPLADQGLPGLSPRFLATIDWMLAPRPADRPASVAALRAVLDGRQELPSRHANLALPLLTDAVGADRAAEPTQRIEVEPTAAQAVAARTAPPFPSSPPSPQVAAWDGERQARRWVPVFMAVMLLLAGTRWTMVSAELPSSAAATAAAVDPRAACARHSLLGLDSCLQRECERPERVTHPQCVQRERKAALRLAEVSPG